ncbi:2-dehydropantoate 2-reductase [Photobacterium sp. SDRW27]|uniref:2-dehydropantoate 2-reductase n=1 Tax=Photobacterium obscurum TaxID=2829490 RepID=UPI00224475E0|nr:2-dehydropantoate 2-reductase [Photobacterium obscurum]MCW8328088.1 2-dehydropantoate 2-reductase [Photobacterium obscurum]
MKFTIVGAGAIGRLWGCKLAEKHQVQFWTRDSTATTLSVDFTPLDSGQELKTYHFDTNNTVQLKAANCVLITVKAFQVQQAITDITPFLSPGIPVIIMHNGMGSQQLALQLLPDNPLLYATTAQGAFRADNLLLNHTGLGQTWIGALNPAGTAYKHLATLLDQVLAPCQWHDDINTPLWQKLAINCAINPLTAIHQCRNGALAKPEFDSQLDQICNEVALVMTAEGYPTRGSNLRNLANKVIRATAENFSSMNQDICQQRTTEIDYITGYLIARAEAHQIQVPVNTRVWQQIKQLEQNYNDQ